MYISLSLYIYTLYFQESYFSILLHWKPPHCTIVAHRSILVGISALLLYGHLATTPDNITVMRYKSHGISNP